MWLGNSTARPTTPSKEGFSDRLRSAGRKSSESLRKKLGRNPDGSSSRTSLHGSDISSPYQSAPAVPSVPTHLATPRASQISMHAASKPLPPVAPSTGASRNASLDAEVESGHLLRAQRSSLTGSIRRPVPQYDETEFNNDISSDDAIGQASVIKQRSNGRLAAVNNSGTGGSHSGSGTSARGGHSGGSGTEPESDAVPPMLSETMMSNFVHPEDGQGAPAAAYGNGNGAAPRASSLRSGAPSPAPSDLSYGSIGGSKRKKKLSLGNFGSKSSTPLPAQTPTLPHSTRGDGNTIAQLYAVFGLPKDPSVWTLAEEDCISGVHHVDGAVGRFWRPEVLGCSICPAPSEVLASEEGSESGRPNSIAGSKKGQPDGSKKPVNPKFLEMADGMGGIEKAETARVLSKALKLSFTREIEIISGHASYPPVSSSHTFSFSVPTARTGAATNAPNGGVTGISVHSKASHSGVGEGFQGVNGDVNGGNSMNEDAQSAATFHGVVLTVWSAADEKRTRAIKKELQRAARARAGDKRGSVRGGAGKRNPASGESEDLSTNEEDAEGFSLLPANNAFFMPYAICIVSRFPIYNLLGDWNKAAWHKHSRNIEKHNQLMSTILRHPAPRIGETFSIQSPDEDVAFVCTFPGALDWGAATLGVDFTMWPLFKTLSVDNILTICEHALAPSGRVLFYSRHPALLGLAVETIRYLVEMRGWKGVSNQNCHARDIKIYLEDPGSWIIAINTELRSIVKPAKQVCVVDLDINFIHCASPPANVPSSKGLRERRRKRLATAFGTLTPEYGPPREFIEAYPGGRFRPLSNISARTAHCPYDRLDPPVWWDQMTVVTAFDKALQEGTRSSFMAKVIKRSAAKQHPQSQAELETILALRRRASTFVDARDGLENKIGRLNKRLAFLMSESEMWKTQFEKIQQLVDRLTKEATDLRSKVDRERRESRRLSSTLAQRDMEQVQLQIQLKETETAREKAKAELARMQQAMESLENEREGMMDEIRNVLSGAGEDLAFLSRFSIMSEANSRSSSPNGSNMTHGSNLTPSQSADFIAKSRALAEQRLSMHGKASGRSSSHGHGTTAGEMRRTRSSENLVKEKEESRSVQNHFPEDQMNQEIQARTSVVTNQISKIQQQLETTLSNLEGRRSGLHERGARRRGSSSSMASRYEYGPPSSLGHGTKDGAASSVAHGQKEYDNVESVSEQKKADESKSRRSGSVAEARSSAPSIKSPPREKEPENGWKELAKRSPSSTLSPSESKDSAFARPPRGDKSKDRAAIERNASGSESEQGFPISKSGFSEDAISTPATTVAATSENEASGNEK